MKYPSATILGVVLSMLMSSACAPLPVAQAPLVFSPLAEPQAEYHFQRSAPTEPYLTRLRTTYRLDSIVAACPTDLAKVEALCAWVHTRWAHDGQNESPQREPIAILQAAAQGKRFRCVEYGIVLSAALTACGIPARTVSLKTMDVETRRSGAGHVLAEAWLADQQKWVLADGQWDVVPLWQGKPLNAVELQKALAEHASGLTVHSAAGTSAATYATWIRPYLFYFDTGLDSRFGVQHTAGSLMLVPVGAKNPTVFQGVLPLTNLKFTHCLRSFYPALVVK
jgi:hypothetical protein